MHSPRNSASIHVLLQAHLQAAAFRLRNQAGEGVISAAIVVLIMAIIGAGMWVVFSRVFDSASGTIETEVGRIGGG